MEHMFLTTILHAGLPLPSLGRTINAFIIVEVNQEDYFGHQWC